MLDSVAETVTKNASDFTSFPEQCTKNEVFQQGFFHLLTKFLLENFIVCAVEVVAG